MRYVNAFSNISFGYTILNINVSMYWRYYICHFSEIFIALSNNTYLNETKKVGPRMGLIK